MRLAEVLEQVRVGDSFCRESKPQILYERIGTLIERNGLGWARVGYGQGNDWKIEPGMRNDEDMRATDWLLHKGSLPEYAPSAKQPRLRPNYTERTRLGWTMYDQMEEPAGR